MTATHDLVIIGAGPIGLAAAAHAHRRGLDTVVLEAGDTAGSAIREWGHVRLFSAWSELVDPVAHQLLQPTGWQHPAPATYPTGRDWADLYLTPLAQTLDASRSIHVRLNHIVTGIAKQDRDRMVDSGRDDAPFTVHAETPHGPVRLLARAVVDASGTYGQPGPLGGDGLPAIGEHAAGDHISYAIPDFDDPQTRDRYAGKHVAVAGTGASAQNVLVGLQRLAQQHPATRVSWLVRRPSTGDAFGGGDNDQLEARGALGQRAREVVQNGPVTVLTTFRTATIRRDATGLTLTSSDGQTLDTVDEVISVTGYRPDLTWLSEVRLDLDPVLSSTSRLAPLIDPNVHSCGTVYPHGAAELAQPEHGLYLVGMKSYGRAPSFLALTGYEQARSIVAAIAGDHEAAARVELVLPESGVCGGSGQFDEEPTENGGGCCTPAAGDLLAIGAPTSSNGCG